MTKSTISILLAILSLLPLNSCNKQKEMDGEVGINHLQLARPATKNVLVIGWDGTQWHTLKKLFDEGKLPNLKKFVSDGRLMQMNIKQGRTQTKPGWAQIFTGYFTTTLGVLSNKKYGPIPTGYTVFERVKKYIGNEAVKVVYLSGKIVNTGGSGPHHICINCYSRDPITDRLTYFWQKRTEAQVLPVYKGKRTNGKRKFAYRKGAPFYVSKNAMDYFSDKQGLGPEIKKKSLAFLEKYHKDRFLMFFHFKEPDEEGHVYGSNSKEYKDKMIQNDRYLGEIMDKMKDLGIYKETTTIITSDHGFDYNAKTHARAPETIFAINKPFIKKDLKHADRVNVAPTILELFGINPRYLVPFLHGESMVGKKYALEDPVIKRGKRKNNQLRVAYFLGGRTQLLYRGYYKDRYKQEGLDVQFISKEIRGTDYHILPKTYKEIANSRIEGKYPAKATGDELIRLMEKGGAELATIGETSYIKAVHRGEPIVAIAELGVDNPLKPGHVIVVRNGIKINGPKDLEKLHWASRRSSGVDMMLLREFLVQEGVNIDKVRFTDMVDEHRSKILLRTKRVDAGFYHLMTARGIVLQDLGYVYRPMNWINPASSSSVLVTTKSFLENNRDLVKKFLKAYVKQIKYENSLSYEERHHNPGIHMEKGKEIQMDFLDMNLPIYRNNPVIVEKNLVEIEKLLIKHKLFPMNEKPANFKDFYDNSLIEEVVKEVFPNE